MLLQILVVVVAVQEAIHWLLKQHPMAETEDLEL